MTSKIEVIDWIQVVSDAKSVSRDQDFIIEIVPPIPTSNIIAPRIPTISSSLEAAVSPVHIIRKANFVSVGN
ncbi:hypothetical protein HK096_005265, partial [Nowakowskiella sp. JEL0078]